MNWLLRKFKEPSTWKGLFVLAGIIGYSIDPALQEQIILAVTAIVAGIEILRNEHKPELPKIDLIATPESIARQLPMQPDYQPKEPAKFVDQQSGWNN